MTDMHVIDALIREAWGDLLARVLFNLENERQESLDVRRRNIIAI
jgi:hypothetical protein